MQSRVAILSLTLPEVPRRQKPRINSLTPSPGDLAQPYHLAVGVEGDAENLGYRSQSADIQTDAAFRDVEYKAFNPRRIRFRDQKARPVIIDPFVLSAAKVISMSHDLSCIVRGDREMLFSAGYQFSLTSGVLETDDCQRRLLEAVPVGVFRGAKDYRLSD